MPVPITEIGIFSAGSPQEEFNFARAYAEELSKIRASKEHFSTTERQRAKIKAAVYAATDLSNSDSMGSFFLNSQDPEDDMYDNFMPTLGDLNDCYRWF